MDVLQPTLSQNPIFGTTGSGGSPVFMKWEYGLYKFLYVIGDVLAYIFSQETWDIIKAVLSILCIFFITVMAYCTVRMFEIRAKEHAHLHMEVEEYAHNQSKREQERRKMEAISKNPRWVNIVNYLASSDSSQWKMAILEADGLLDNLLTSLNFPGEGVGEKLRSPQAQKFKKLNEAWEVHNIRNKIAHESSTFLLSSREAKRVITLYEQIFREYGFI